VIETTARSIGTPDEIPPRSTPATGSGPDQFEVITDIGFLDALKDHWHALCERVSRHYYTQTYEWSSCNWEFLHAPKGHRLHCVVARNGGRIVLIWPFVIFREFLSPVARPLGNSYGEYTTVLVEDGPSAHLRVSEALRLLRASCRCSVVILPYVPAETELEAILSVDKAARIDVAVPTFSVRWEGFRDWDAYLGSLKAADRREFGRTRRRLEERGKLTFDVVDGGECTALVDWMIAQKLQQLSRTNRRSSLLERPEYRNFLLTAIARPSPTGRFVMFTLKLEDQLLAVLLSRLDRVRVEGVITVYDPTYSKFGPGQLLWETCLKWACERRLEFDLRGGDFQYKRNWTNHESRATSYEIANSFGSAAYFIAKSLSYRAYRFRELVPQSWRESVKSVIRRRQ